MLSHVRRSWPVIADNRTFSLAKANESTNHGDYFSTFRNNIIGKDLKIPSSNGSLQPVVYADWTASGRLYKPIEDRITNVIGPYCANTHSETTELGVLMTLTYHEAINSLKKHVHAGDNGIFDDLHLQCLRI
jgi:selenocysteine lyase/cysteine desulfurase